MSRVAVPSIEADLANYAAVTHEAMGVYLPDTEPRQHLWDLVDEYPRRGGKAIRPALCLATAVAFGAGSAETPGMRLSATSWSWKEARCVSR